MHNYKLQIINYGAFESTLKALPQFIICNFELIIIKVTKEL